MKWEVIGANRETGEDTSIQIEADTEESAIRRAGRRGVLASSAVPLSNGLDSVAAVEVVPPADPLSMLAAAAPAPAARTHGYQTPSGRRSTSLPANGLGVAGLVIGIVSMLICWIPLLGFISIPLSLLGLILAAVGTIMSLSNKRTGVGFPIAGVVTCAASIGLVIVVNTVFFTGLGNALSQVQAQQAATIHTSPPGPTPTPLTSSAPASNVVPADQWVSCAEPVVLGDVTVRFIYSKIEKIPLKTGSEDGGESADPCLAIGISITNSSGIKKIDYSGWQGKAISLGGGTATLTDDAGNNYPRIDFGTNKAAGQVDDVGIYPGQTISDVLVFEIPAPAAQTLKLEAPGSNVGASGKLRWLIPALLPRMQPRGT